MLMMQDVQPYYAVKCNPNPRIIECLADMGGCFDCASPSEIKLVLSCGIHPSRIIYANPCKKESDIAFAATAGITTTTFDSICELEKLHKIAPKMKLFFRIFASDPTAQCVLSNKYGAHEYEWEAILARAEELGMDICGVSFHVGSGARDATVYKSAVASCCKFKNVATNFGFKIETIDIGGGFTTKTLDAIANQVCEARTQYCDDLKDVVFIAEPGRYFVETVATFYTKIINVKHRPDGTVDYWLTDGLYGSFNCLLYDHSVMTAIPLENVSGEVVASRLWGPTCDNADEIGVHKLPVQKCGAWLAWANAGAYTIAGACDFNGVNFTNPSYVYHDKK